MQTELKTVLEDLGLNEIEASVYLANLKVGPAIASKVAREAGLNRVTTYEALKRLSEKGFVKIRAKKSDKVKYFEAEDIDALEAKLEDKSAQIQETIKGMANLRGKFHGLYAAPRAKPAVLFYEGKEGIKRALLDSLAQKPREILSFASADFLEMGFEKRFLDGYWRKRTDLKIPSRGIMPETPKALSTFTPERNLAELRRVKFIKKREYEFKNELDIYGDSVSIISLEAGDEHAVVIRSPSVAESLKSLYEYLWELI